MEKDYNNVLKQFEDCNDDEKKALKRYLEEENLAELEIEQLEKIYLRNMENQKAKIEEKIDTSKIKGLISCVSFSYNKNPKKYMENTYDRNINIFSNIDTFFLLYTEQSKKIFDRIKDVYKNINIIGVLVTDYTFLSIQNSINETLKKLKLDKNNCIIDITLGMKMITICLYKLAVENEIKAINWQEIQVKNFKTPGVKNFPFNSKLNIMIEPRKENMKMYAEINDLLEKYNFDGVASFYNRLNNEDMQFFYKNLAKLFSFEVMINLDYTLFYKRVEEFFVNLCEKKEYKREFKIQVRNFLINFLRVIVINEDGDFIEYPWLDSFLKLFQITEEDIYSDDSYLNEYKEHIYFYFVLKYFQAKIKANSEENYYYTKFINDIKKNIVAELDVDDKEKENKFMKENGEIEELFEIDLNQALKEMTPELSLKENLNGEFYFKNNVIYIEKYNLKIDITGDKRLKFLNNKGSDLIREILETPREKIEKDILFKKLAKYNVGESEENRQNRFRKNLTTFKNKVETLNKTIKEIGKEQGLELDNIILYEKNKRFYGKSDYSHAFYVNSKYYILM